MAYIRFDPSSNAPDPLKNTADDVARRIFRDDLLPAITNAANRILRREDAAMKVNNDENAEAAAKMFGIWEEAFELVHMRVGELFPEILQGNPPSVRDVRNWRGGGCRREAQQFLEALRHQQWPRPEEDTP